MNENASVSETPDGFIITTITTLKNKVQKDLLSADKYCRIADNNCQMIANFLNKGIASDDKWLSALKTFHNYSKVMMSGNGVDNHLCQHKNAETENSIQVQIWFSLQGATKATHRGETTLE